MNLRYTALVALVVLVAAAHALEAAPGASAAPPAEAKLKTVDVFGQLSKLPPVPKGQVRGGRVTVSGNVEPTLIQSDGSFALVDVPLGSYIATIEFDDIVWPLIRIDVTEGRHGVLRIRAATHDVVGSTITLPGGDDAANAIEVPPVGRHGYYVPREEFSPMSFLKNPMVLMMVVSMGMIGMMKLLPQDELRQQMKELSQATSGKDAGPAAITKKKE